MKEQYKSNKSSKIRVNTVGAYKYFVLLILISLLDLKPPAGGKYLRLKLKSKWHYAFKYLDLDFDLGLLWDWVWVYGDWTLVFGLGLDNNKTKYLRLRRYDD